MRDYEHSELTRQIIGAAIEIHRHLGPRLLESTYESCLVYELEKLGLTVQHQVALPVVYKELHLPKAYRIDLLVNEQIVVELKAVDNILTCT